MQFGKKEAIAWVWGQICRLTGRRDRRKKIKKRKLLIGSGHCVPMLSMPFIDLGLSAKVTIGCNEPGSPNRYSVLLPSSDSDRATFLATDNTNEPYITIDLGRRYDVDQLRLWCHPIVTKSAPRHIRIEVSVDNLNWTLVHESAVTLGSSFEQRPWIVSIGADIYPRFIKISLNEFGQLWLQYVECLFRLPSLQFGFLHHFCNEPGNLSAIYSTHPWGLFSNVSTAFADMMKAKRSGLALRAVSFSAGMLSFKSSPNDDNRPILFKSFTQEAFLGLSDIDFDAYDVHKPYHMLPVTDIGRAINVILSPSESVRHEAERLTKTMSLDAGNTIAICYRGTDKKTEVTLASIESYILIAETIRKKFGSDLDVFIQTDQGQARDAVVQRFGKSTRFIDDMPVTRGETAIHNLDLEGEFNLSREQFSVRMFATMLLMARCKFLIVHTGNIAAWTVFYRGSCDGVFQFDANGNLVHSNNIDHWSNLSL